MFSDLSGQRGVGWLKGDGYIVTVRTGFSVSNVTARDLRVL